MIENFNNSLWNVAHLACISSSVPNDIAQAWRATVEFNCSLSLQAVEDLTIVTMSQTRKVVWEYDYLREKKYFADKFFHYMTWSYN